MSWVQYNNDTDFPIQNLPYGVFRKRGSTEKGRIGVAIGDHVLDLSVIDHAGMFHGQAQSSKCFQESTLNTFMSLGRPTWKEARAVITKLLSANEGALRDNAELKAKALVSQHDVEMLMPANIGDYTDFYASKEHATNVGTMWRGKENALMPNWVHLPVGYHGRSSSIVISGTPVRRPRGQTRPNEQEPPQYGPSKVIDYELEVAWFIGPGNNMGDPISVDQAEDHIFGLALMNDWSARDVQKWEYVPLGPFTGKNWATTISPWIVTLEALEPFRTQGPEQNPVPFDYIKDKGPSTYDINLFSYIKTEKMKGLHQISHSNFKYLYWSMKQQIAHHTVTGCNLRPGDLLASGTISGPTPETYGALIETTWGGSKPFTIQESGEERKYIQDGDTIIFKGHAQGADYRIGFGQCIGTLLPAHK